MPLRFAPPRDGTPEREVLRDLERVLRDVLGETDERFDVRFGAWRAEDGRLRYLCKVESPPGDPFEGDAQWRWWSPLVDGADELRDALWAAVARRGRRPAAATSIDTPPHAEAAGA